MYPTSTSATSESTLPTVGQRASLRRRWLVLLRVAWLALAALCLTTFAFSVPISFVQEEQVCNGNNCSQPYLTSQDIHALAHAGLSPAFFATYFTALSIVFVLVWVVMGALIFVRKSDEPHMLYFAFFLVAFGTIWLADPGSTLAVANPAWTVPAAVINFFAGIFFLVFGYLFPTGRFVPRWTRFLALVLIAATVPSYFFPSSAVDVNNGGWLDAVFSLTLFVSAIFAQIYRYRRVSTPVERQQTKWVMLALVAALVIYASAVFIPANPGLLFKFIGATALELALLLVPIAIGVSIFRYHLWDVDSLVSKVLIYGLLTGLLGGLYVGLIIGLEAAAGAITGTADQPIALVISTLVIAALFQPVRLRIQRVIDRSFYRRKYDAEKTMSAFSVTLQGDVDLEHIQKQLLAVVHETMQPVDVWLWLPQPEPQLIDQAHRLQPQSQLPTMPNTERAETLG